MMMMMLGTMTEMTMKTTMMTKMVMPMVRVLTIVVVPNVFRQKVNVVIVMMMGMIMEKVIYDLTTTNDINVSNDIIVSNDKIMSNDGHSHVNNNLSLDHLFTAIIFRERT